MDTVMADSPQPASPATVAASALSAIPVSEDQAMYVPSISLLFILNIHVSLGGIL
jgi:hypothetical protein